MLSEQVNSEKSDTPCCTYITLMYNVQCTLCNRLKHANVISNVI